MTTPTGRLAYGQAGVYDAVDDRSVISAVTGYRTGLIGTVEVRAGSGLNIVLGGWLAIADCGDATSAVVGTRAESVVQANPGPPTGSRVDYIWCDVEPDEGVWSLVVIPASTAAGRPGIPVALVTVPANATLASQMDIRPAEATLERRLIGFGSGNDGRTLNATTWESAPALVWTGRDRTDLANCPHEPGQWYRVRFTASSPAALTGALTHRAGIGWHAVGAPSPTTLLLRSASFSPARYNADLAYTVEHVFRWPADAAPTERVYEGRIWSVGGGTYRVEGVTGQGPTLMITCEDMGS